MDFTTKASKAPFIEYPRGLAKRSALRAFRFVVRYNLAAHHRRFQYAFILAHMRSGSTLLSHLLAGHQDFAGAAETHVHYRTRDDLASLAITICQRLRKFDVNKRYLVDQINHDGYITEDVLSFVDKIVLLVRHPKPTLESIIAAFEWDERRAVDYYVSRLGTLGRYADRFRERTLFIEYDDLINDAETSLDKLTAHFGVTPRIRPDYKTSKATSRFGDRSQNIVKGEIIKTAPHDISISREALAASMLAFENYRHHVAAAML